MSPSGAEVLREIKSRIDEVDPGVVREQITNGATLVDVRETDEFAALGGGDGAPFEVGGVGLGDCFAGVFGALGAADFESLVLFALIDLRRASIRLMTLPVEGCAPSSFGIGRCFSFASTNSFTATSYPSTNFDRSSFEAFFVINVRLVPATPY